MPIVHGLHLCSTIFDFLNNHKGEFEYKLIPDLSHIDHTAHNVNGIKIEAVEYVDTERYKLVYSYDWEVYRGCSDIHDTDVEYDSVIFKVTKNGFVDIDDLKVIERDTSDEF